MQECGTPQIPISAPRGSCPSPCPLSPSLALPPLPSSPLSTKPLSEASRVRATAAPQRPSAGRRGSRERGRLGAGSRQLRPAPLPLAARVPPPPRRSRLRRSRRLCNVSRRSGGDASGSGPGPALAGGTARPGPAGAHRASPRPLAAPGAGSARPGPTPLRPCTKHRGHRGPGLRPPLHRAQSPCRRGQCWDRGDAAPRQRPSRLRRCATDTGAGGGPRCAR